MTLFQELVWNTCWRGTLLLVIALVTLLCIPHRFLAIRSAILRICLIGLLVAPLTTLLPHLRIPVLPGIQSEARPTLWTPELASSIPPTFAPEFVVTVPTMAMNETSNETTGQSDEPLNANSNPLAVEASVPIRVANDHPNVVAIPLERFENSSSSILHIDDSLPGFGQVFRSNFVTVVTIAYGIGFVIILVRLGLGLLKLRHLHRGSQLVNSLAWIDDLREYRRTLGIARSVQLRSSSSITTPLTFGFLRPTLVVPSTMITASVPMQRKVILLHELTHVRRNDFVTELTVHFMLAIYWFQPLAWLLARSIRATQEDLCDAECSAEFGDDVYSNVLIEIARTLRIAPSLTLALAMARTSRLARRLARIQFHSSDAIVRLTRRAACATGIVVLPFVIGLMLIDPAPAQQTDAAGDVAPVSQTELEPKQGDTSPDLKKEPDHPGNENEAEEPTVDAANLRPEVALPRVVFRLVDAKTNSPLANTTVKLRRLITPRHPFRFEPEIRESTSDQDGIVAVSMQGIADEVKFVRLEIDADGKAIDVAAIALQRTAEEYPLQTVSLSKGLEIATKVFDADGQPASGACVEILSDWGAKHFDICQSYATCSDDGTLRFRVPQNSTFGLIVVSDHCAPFRIVYPAGTTRIRDIRLSRGATIAGQLIDRDGKPIPDAAIVLNGDDSQATDTEFHVGRHGTGAMRLEFTRSTDQQGRFQFPPMTGSVRIQLDEWQPASTDMWNPGFETALNRVLDRESKLIQAAAKDGAVAKKRIGFPYTENRSSEEIGDFGDQIYHKIVATINKSESFELVNPHSVRAALKQTGLNTKDLNVPDGRQQFVQAMEQQHQQGVDYFLCATLTDGTRRSNRKGNFQLTLELVNLESGKIEEDSTEVRMVDCRTLAGRLIPVDLDLPAVGDVWVPLMLAPTGTVSGTVRDENGKPASHVEVDVVIPPRISRSYLRLCRVFTDLSGHYEAPVPFPIDNVEISCFGCGEDGYFVSARPVGADANERGNHKALKHYVGESMTVDWVLPSKRVPTGREVSKPVIDPALLPLAELESEIKKVMDAGNDPRDSMTDRCLEFEAQHRGTRMAIGALHYVTRAQATSSSRKPRDACLRAIEVMRQHYINHPDVDLLITEFDSGGGMPECEPLLLKLSDASPYAYVRAQALLELARHRFLMKHLKEKVYIKARDFDEQLEKQIAMTGPGSMKQYLRDQLEHRKQMRKILSEMDSESLQQSALELLERVITGYQGVTSPVRHFQATTGEHYPDLMLVDQHERPTWKIRTAAERAEILRFQMTRLQEGMKAPEIEGLDLQQHPIRLSQFRGKFVLLTVTHSNAESELFAECARIVQSQKNDEFVCVSVIPGQGSGGYSALAIVDDGKVTWPIIRDSAENDIANFWCQTTFPSMYLIDPQGVIRSIDEGDHLISQLGERVHSQIRQGKKK